MVGNKFNLISDHEHKRTGVARPWGLPQLARGAGVSPGGGESTMGSVVGVPARDPPHPTREAGDCKGHVVAVPAAVGGGGAGDGGLLDPAPDPGPAGEAVGPELGPMGGMLPS